MILAFQLLNTEEQKILKKQIEQIEQMVLEEEKLYNEYKCIDCNHFFKSRLDWFEIRGCPKCRSFNVNTMMERFSLYDIEFAMESNRDFNSFFIRYSTRVTKFDITRRLNKIKSWIFSVIRSKAESRRFKRFR
jgi:hypothetical protein